MDFVHGSRIRSYRYVRRADDPNDDTLDPEVLCCVESDYSESVFVTNSRMKATALEMHGGDPKEHRRAAEDEIPPEAVINRKYCYK